MVPADLDPAGVHDVVGSQGELLVQALLKSQLSVHSERLQLRRRLVHVDPHVGADDHIGVNSGLLALSVGPGRSLAPQRVVGRDHRQWRQGAAQRRTHLRLDAHSIRLSQILVRAPVRQDHVQSVVEPRAGGHGVPQSCMTRVESSLPTAVIVGVEGPGVVVVNIGAELHSNGLLHLRELVHLLDVLLQAPAKAELRGGGARIRPLKAVRMVGHQGCHPAIDVLGQEIQLIRLAVLTVNADVGKVQWIGLHIVDLEPPHCGVHTEHRVIVDAGGQTRAQWLMSVEVVVGEHE
mmetsp:Transcript_33432/g.62336  ORF Transcript_33432/g.62336 Transcript_33432/m.62336 type:complete len:292 (+) Transcript_33432:1950-2825(+)